MLDSFTKSASAKKNPFHINLVVSMNNIKMLQVKFVVHCKKIRTHEQIKIVGNLPAIGSWNPLNGLAL